MVISKKKQLKNLFKILLLVYLIIFPFGQLVRTNFTVLGRVFPIHPTDILAGFSISILFTKHKFSQHNRIVYPFFASGIFSLILSFALYSPYQVLFGSLYLLRLFAYYCLFLTTYFLVDNEIGAEKIYTWLFKVLVVVAVLGWFQYLFIPDLRFLRFSGWDDHKSRLAGTFLDPGFTGIILVFGFVMSLDRFLKIKKPKTAIETVFFLATVLLTYSRSTYLALFAALWVMVHKLKHGSKYFLAVSIILAVGIIILPRPRGSEGVKLERIYSIEARMNNYVETYEIFKKQTLFGVGYNNICWEKFDKDPNISSNSHACFGSDSSLLLLLTTFGTVGAIISLNSLNKFRQMISAGKYSRLLYASIIAIVMHSFFVNSLFYSWVLGYFAIIFSLNLSKEKK